MGAIDMLLINHDLIAKGFKEILGIKEYLLVFDQDSNIICALYDMDSCRTVVEEYLKRQGLDRTLVKFEKKSIKNKAEELKEILQHKVVILDGELTLYKHVAEKAKDYDIQGYDGKMPKYGINKYTTMAKK